MSAVLETENALLPRRIYEALAAIEQRRPGLTAADGIEERQWKGLKKDFWHLSSSERETNVLQSALELAVQDNRQKGLIDSDFPVESRLVERLDKYRNDLDAVCTANRRSGYGDSRSVIELALSVGV